MKNILTMTLNPCIDRTIYFDSFNIGATNIVKKIIEEPAGKGINVAVGLKHLNLPVKAMGFSFEDDSAKLYKKLEKEGIPYVFVETQGHLRINQKIFDESNCVMTECNEKGCTVTESKIRELLELLEKELDTTLILVLSGSVPPGTPADIYAKMIEMANQYDVKVVLDATGELLREGLKATPYLIKPNREEFIKTFELADKTDLIDKAEELLRNGLEYICLSEGKEGARLIRWNGMEGITVDHQAAIDVPIRSLQGAGDAMVAGLCKGIYEGKTSRIMLQYALKMAASTIMQEGSSMGNGMIDETEVSGCF